MNLLHFFSTLVGKVVVFMLPEEDAIKGMLVDYDYEIGMFLIKSDDDQLVALNQRHILMVSAYVEPVTASEEIHDEPTSSDKSFDGHGYGPNQPNGDFGG